VRKNVEERIDINVTEEYIGEDLRKLKSYNNKK
jgi:hypothetical protein